jgi:DNA-binding NarL/FixJ family response regulator
MVKQTGNIRVQIAEDQASQRKLLEHAIGQQPDMVLIAAADNGYEAVMQAGLHVPDVILMDIEMESATAGIHAAKQINQNLPEVKIIVLTAHKDQNLVCAAFQTGIVDYLIKDAPMKVVMEAVRQAHEKKSPIRPIIAEKIREELKRSKEREEGLLYIIKLISDLTATELEVLRLLYEGKSRREIASQRFVELGTVKIQIHSILQKTHKNSSKELVKVLKKYQIFETLSQL